MPFLVQSKISRQKDWRDESMLNGWTGVWCRYPATFVWKQAASKWLEISKNTKDHVTTSTCPHTRNSLSSAHVQSIDSSYFSLKNRRQIASMIDKGLNNDFQFWFLILPDFYLAKLSRVSLMMMVCYRISWRMPWSPKFSKLVWT